jgi:hypothetical protein
MASSMPRTYSSFGTPDGACLLAFVLWPPAAHSALLGTASHRRMSNASSRQISHRQREREVRRPMHC